MIPVFNEESSIGDSLDSLAAQRRPIDECIIVDNNSTDRTVDIVDEFTDRLPIRVIRESRQGATWARRTGNDSATGDVIGVIDADTLVEPGWTEVIERYLTDNPEIDGISGPFYFHDSPFAERGRRNALSAAEEHGLRDVGHTALSGGNSAFRREVWHSSKRHMKNLPGTHEDVDFTYALGVAGARLRRVPALVAAISTRRYEASIRSNWGYLTATVRTQRAHGDHRTATVQTVLLPLNIVQIAVSGLVFRPYDPTTGKWRPFRRAAVDRVSPVT
nr:glycosyltransferase family A protein [Gordonia soli]